MSFSIIYVKDGYMYGRLVYGLEGLEGIHIPDTNDHGLVDKALIHFHANATIWNGSDTSSMVMIAIVSVPVNGDDFK